MTLLMNDQRENEPNDVVQLLLSRSGLEAWARVCLTLLALTAGIERYMEREAEHPHRDLLQRVQRALSSEDEAALFEIAGLHVFEYRVMSEETLELWQPLQESLEQFRKRHTENVRVWRDFSAHPPRAEIEKWLHQHVFETDEC